MTTAAEPTINYLTSAAYKEYEGGFPGYCPLLMIANARIGANPHQIRRDAECMESSCAWYNRQTRRCVVHTIIVKEER